VISRFITKIAIAFAMLLIGLTAGVIAILFFAYAVYLALLNVLVSPAAAAITGVVVIAAALLLMAALRLLFRPRRRRVADMPSLEECENAADIGSELGRRIRGLAGASTGGGLLAALLAGFAVGISPKLRAFLQSLLKS
jgi:hypothetical protein